MFDSSVYSTQTMNTANRLRLVEQLSEQWGTFTLEKYKTENLLPKAYKWYKSNCRKDSSAQIDQTACENIHYWTLLAFTLN